MCGIGYRLHQVQGCDPVRRFRPRWQSWQRMATCSEAAWSGTGRHSLATSGIQRQRLQVVSGWQRWQPWRRLATRQPWRRLATLAAVAAVGNAGSRGGGWQRWRPMATRSAGGNGGGGFLKKGVPLPAPPARRSLQRPATVVVPLAARQHDGVHDRCHDPELLVPELFRRARFGTKRNGPCKKPSAHISWRATFLRVARHCAIIGC
jgi:hypothetical protein